MNSGKIFRTEDNGADYITITIDKPLITVKITSLLYPVSGVGHAKCDPTDKWNEALGSQLAYSRALARTSNKLVKYLVKSASRS